MPDLLLNDAADLAEDARRLLLELDRDVPGAAVGNGGVPPAARRRRDRRRASKSSSTSRAWRRRLLRVAVRRNTVLVVGVKLGAGESDAARAISSRRAELRPLRARGAARRGAIDATRARGHGLERPAARRRCRASRIAAARVIAIPVDARMTRLLFIGDIVGRPGRELVRRGLAALVAHHQIDLVIANVENAAAGFGITPDIADDFLEYGVHVMTGGNHTWDKKEIIPYFADQPRLLRPANLPAGAPGRAAYVARASNGVPVAVDQRHGPRVHDRDRRSVSRGRRARSRRVRRRRAIVFVDFHAEATSEKVAHGLAPRRPRDGRRRHAHARADRRRARAAAGHGVHHRRRHDRAARLASSASSGRAIVQRFLTALPQRFETATENPRLNAVVVAADETTGRATSHRAPESVGAGHRGARRRSRHGAR